MVASAPTVSKSSQVHVISVLLCAGLCSTVRVAGHIDWPRSRSHLRDADVLNFCKVLRASKELLGHAVLRESLHPLFVQRDLSVDLANLFPQPYEGKVIVAVHYQHVRLANLINAAGKKRDEGLLQLLNLGR